MHLTYRNVNFAFSGLVSGIATGSLPTRKMPSRAGNVIMVDEPVIVTLENPRERVLFNQARDCNPFFHLFESLWMLAGRNDVEPLAYFSSNIAEVASDDGKTFNGAYGYRWRRAPVCVGNHPNQPPAWEYTCDQLRELVDYLRNHPEGRRAVLQMWNVEDDLLKVEWTKDVCCNVCAFFSIREETPNRCDKDCGEYQNAECPGSAGPCVVQKGKQFLDMTVINRSNDLIWGMLGANVVHFSFLQEYMAARLGVEVGKYNQITNNLHVYERNWKPDEWLDYGNLYYAIPPYWYGLTQDQFSVPLVKDPETFDREVQLFIDNWKDVARLWKEPFLELVAIPMCDAFEAHKERDYAWALTTCANINASDWRLAATRWIQKRKAMWEARNHD